MDSVQNVWWSINYKKVNQKFVNAGMNFDSLSVIPVKNLIFSLVLNNWLLLG